MKISILFLLFLSVSLRAQEPASPTPSPEPEASSSPDLVKLYETSASARAKALELAGAFTNEGFKIRDGFYAAKLAPGESQAVAVNLFSSNEYWFCVGTDEAGRKVDVAVYDGGGNRLEVEPFEGERMAGAGIIPAYSGEYYIVVELKEGEPSEYVLLYAFK